MREVKERLRSTLFFRHTAPTVMIDLSFPLSVDRNQGQALIGVPFAWKPVGAKGSGQQTTNQIIIIVMITS